MSLGASETLLAQFEEHLVLAHLSPLTVVNYLADLRAFSRWGLDRHGTGFSLATLTPNNIRAYRAHLLEDKRCANATVNRRLQALRKFCAFAVRAGVMISNPAEGVQLVQGEGTVPAVPLTGVQIRELLRASGNEQSSLTRRDTAILRLLLHTGLRLGELVDLRLDDVQFDNPGTHLTVRDARNGEVRRVPLDGDVRHALYEYLSVRPNAGGEVHLFLSREGRPLSMRSVQRIVSTRARAAGLEGISPQALRRTYASRLLAATGDLALVSRRLGHPNLETTSRYLSASLTGQLGEPAAR